MTHSILVSTAELAANLQNPAWVICDCRHDLMDTEKGRRAYQESHIPGAQFLHLDEDLSGAKTGRNGRHPLPDPVALAARLSKIGVDSSKRVIGYDDTGGPYAARLWWTLTWLGHPGAAILDGGIAAWVREGRPVTADVPRATPAYFVPRPKHDKRVEVGDVLASLSSKKTLIVDARAQDRFQGLTEPIDPVAGHIPGARNRFFKDNLTADGLFKSPEQLRGEFLALLGERSADQVVNQCGSGVTACHNLFAMELAGLTGSKLYPGSWSEWCADPARPVERA